MPLSIQTFANTFNPLPVRDMTWPPDEDQARLDSYTRCSMIMDGDHLNVFSDRAELNRYGVYIPANISKKIVYATSDLLFGEPVALEYPEEANQAGIDFCDELWKEQKLQQLYYEGSVDGGSLGDDVYQVRKEENQALIESVQAKNWFPVRDPDNVRKVLQHRLAITHEVRINGKLREFVKMMIHEKGRIINQLWEVEGGKLKTPYGPGTDPWNTFMGVLPEVEETGVEDFLIVHIPSWRAARQFFGEKELEGIKELQSELNSRLSQGSHVLTNHAEPIIKGPPNTILDENNEYDASLRAFEISEDSEHEKIEYVTYDGKLSDGEAFIERIIDLMLLLTETSKDLLGIGKGGVEASGRALKFAARSTLAKVNRRRQNYNVGIPQCLLLAQMLEGISDPVRPKLVWSDGLPQDDGELLEILDRRLANQTLSRKSFIMRMDDLGDDEADQALEAIDEDEATATQNIVASRPRPPLAPVTQDLGEGL